MIRPRSLFSLVIATALCSLALPAASGVHNNQGTLKVHDLEDENPDVRNVPHVDCDFWLESFNLGDDAGWIVFYAWPPTGDMTEVDSGSDQNWTADDGEPAFHMIAGPFTLATGHYRVEIYTEDGHPGQTEGNPHFAKAKTFWVECEAEENPPCPPGLELVAASNEGEPTITLTWEAVEGADTYVVYAAADGADFEAIGMTNETTFVDDEVVQDVTYEYYVTAVIGDVESENCEIESIVAIPFFPNAIVGALAVLAGIGAIVVMRRRNH